MARGKGVRSSEDSVLGADELVHYILGVVGLKPNQVKFVTLDGSMAVGEERKFSDYDIVVVVKLPSLIAGRPLDFHGFYKGRLVAGWLVDEEGFRTEYIGGDDESFLWRRHQIDKAKLLFGDVELFGEIIDRALKRQWTDYRQNVIVSKAYSECIEYMGKLLNSADEGEIPEFRLAAGMLAHNMMIFVAGINKIDLKTDRTMYRQILAEAKVRPTGLERDFRVVYGYSAEVKSSSEVVKVGRRLVKWARRYLIQSYGLERFTFDGGFAPMVEASELMIEVESSTESVGMD